MKSIFISSTFKDMQAERDLIHLRILPELSEFAREYGETIHLSDMRWGISTEDLDMESGAKKVLQSCLFEIKNCKPYMVVLIGNRYGWTPDKELILRASQEIGFQSSDSEKSVTELEIEYGVFSEDQMDKCVFCFREEFDTSFMTLAEKQMYFSSTVDDQRRLVSLKRKIRDRAENRILPYKANWDADKKAVVCDESFVAELTRLLKEVLANEWGHPYENSWMKRCAIGENYVVEQKLLGYTPQKDFNTGLLRLIRENSSLAVLLTGDSGCGKSTELAFLAETLKQEHFVLTAFPGDNALLNTPDLIMRYFAQMLHAENHDEDTFAYNQTCTKGDLTFEANLFMRQTGRRLIFLIDIDWELSELPEVKNADILPELGESGIIAVMAVPGGFALNKWWRDSEKCMSIAMPEPSDEDVRMTLLGKMELYRKTLYPGVFQQVTYKYQAKNHLYLSYVLTRLLMMSQSDYIEIETLAETLSSTPQYQRGEEALKQHMISLVKEMPRTKEELLRSIVFTAFDRIAPMLQEPILNLLGTARHGLRESDLEQILHENGYTWDKLAFLAVKRYLRDILIELSDGRIGFSNLMERACFMPSSAEEQIRWHNMIACHLGTLETSDMIKNKELAFHAYYANKPSAIYEQLHRLQESGNSEILSIFLRSLHDIIILHNIGNSLYQQQVPTIIERTIMLAKECNNGSGNNVCSTLIFAFQDLFAEDIGLNIKNRLSDLLLEAVTALTEKTSSCDPDIVRLLYICYEQMGMRSLSQQERIDWYWRFLNTCQTYYESAPTAVSRSIDVVRDLTVAYIGVAKLYHKRNWKRAVELYDRALEYARMPISDNKRPTLLLEYQASIMGNLGECYTEEAALKIRIGWDADACSEMLDKAGLCYKQTAELWRQCMLQRKDLSRQQIVLHKYSECQRWAYYYLQRRNMPESKMYCDLAFTAAMEHYHLTGSSFSHDYARNALYVKAEYSDDPSEKARLLEATLKIILEEKTMTDSPIIPDILAITVSTLAKLYKDFYDSADGINEKLEIAIRILELQKAIMDSGLSGSNSEYIEPLQRTISYIMREYSVLKPKSDQMVQGYLNRKRYEAATHNALLVDKLLSLLCPLFNDIDSQMSYQMQIQHLCKISTLYNNWRIASYTDKTIAKIDTDPEELHCKKGLALLIQYRELFGEDSFTRDIKWYFKHLLYFDLSLAKANISHLAWLINNRQYDKLWSYLTKFSFFIDAQQFLFPQFCDESCARDLNIIAEFICDHLDDHQSLTLLYRNDPIECATLRYAYRTLKYKQAHEIIYNGYDHYLELDLIHIVHEYDKQEFSKLIDDLKSTNYRRWKKQLKIQYRPEFNHEFLSEIEEAIRRNKHR